jgi:hypothetical protein
MSAISEKVRTALYAALNVSGVTSLASGGIHYKIAPEGTETPYVVFNRFPAQVHYGLGNNLVGERDEWLIKALTDEDSSTTKEPSELAEEILTAAETAIGTTLTLTGNTVRRVRRVREMPDYLEPLGDRVIWHHGFFLEVFTD